MKTIRRWVLAPVMMAAVLLGMTGCVTDDGSASKWPPPSETRLGAPFCDHAVLQRGAEVPVWGWSAPGTQITVTFAGQTETATADDVGKWMVTLDPLKASFDPEEMVVSDDKEKTLTVKNILVGEVWMASGQSNMQWKTGKSTSSNLKVEPVGEKKVNPIREFEVTSVYAMLHPIKKATGAWKDGNYGDHSAIAFAFAHKLYEELKVPIGILNCSFSQTKIQAWVPRVGFRGGEDAYTQNLYQQVLKTDPATPEHEAAWAAYYQSVQDALKAGEAISTDVPGNMGGNRDSTWLFNGRLSPVVPYAITGGIWNQGYANSGEGLPYYNNLHSLVRGWRLLWDEPDLPVYFHQFYTAGNGTRDGKPSIGGTAEMRLGTAMARDIPNANMASQIDIQGAIHYRHKAVPGQRLALHALKNQYDNDVVADGPIFKAYTVEGDKVIVEFDYADGGLVVADPRYHAIGRKEDSTGFADPKLIPNGADRVKLFYVAGEDRVWHPASVTLDGEKVVLRSTEVKDPHGVTYGTGGIGFQPNLYNKALLPMTPFIVFDNKRVTSKDWPAEKLKVAGETIDPDSVGNPYMYRKMPVLSTQFRDNAVLQADKPVKIWGGAVHPFITWGSDMPRPENAVVRFSFNGIEKEIPVTDDMMEWSVTVPPMKASAEPKTLKAAFFIGDELVHERVATNVVVGDVWYVAAPQMKMDVPKVKPSGQIVRMMARQAKRDSNNRPSRFSVCVSTTPYNRFASYWKDASGFAAALGHRIAAKAGRPVGIIFMGSRAGKGAENPPLKRWMPPEALKDAPSLLEDYKQLASLTPGNAYYEENANRYVQAWKTYWSEYIPEMIATEAVPDGVKWGRYPRLAGEVTTKATQVYNVMVHSLTPAALKGVVFLSSPATVKADKGKHFGEQMTALANGLKARFGVEDASFIYTMPDRSLAAEITKPDGINGASHAVEVSDWNHVANVLDTVIKKVY